MKTKLAGHLQLHDMVANVLQANKSKLAADDKSEKVKKLVEYEKKEHGGKIPSVSEEKAEHKNKESSVIDYADPVEVEKLASALDYLTEKLGGDSVFLGGEARQGGEVLATMSAVPGAQGYRQNGSKKHKVPMGSGLMATKDNPGAATAVPTDDHRAPGGTGAKYPAKGVLKTGSADETALSVHERIQAAKMRAQGVPAEQIPQAVAMQKQSASALNYLLAKVSGADIGGESKQGGETLANSAPVPSNPGRQLISSNSAPASATKREAKAPRKKELAEVLTEPAMTSSTDSKVQENLRNASKGGVKIAAAKALLAKIAEEGCTCGNGGECRNCKLKKAVADKKAS